MATQNDAGVPFLLVPEESQEHFRLLELPPDLLDLLTQSQPETLQLKSLEGLGANSSGAQAVLCSKDKTYTIRQVSTSNSVYLTRPGEVTVDDGGGFSEPAMEAFAQLGSFLELQPAGRQSAAPYIHAALPVYSSTGYSGNTTTTTRDELFAHIPLSSAECEDAWTSLSCFETGEPLRAFIPSATAKLQAWQSILVNATASGIGLSKPLQTSDLQQVLSSDDDSPPELASAVIATMSSDRTLTAPVMLDEKQCVRIVGTILLEVKALQSCNLQEFKAAWADALPEEWRGTDGPKLEAIGGRYKLNGSNISMISNAEAGSDAPKENKSTLGAKRGWHEKFRQVKKAG